MSNHSKLVEYNKNLVIERKKRINDACNELLLKDKELTYKNISEIAGIPHRTLESKRYSNYIKNIKQKRENEVKSGIDNKYISEIKHLNDIIKKLRIQNNELKLALFRDLYDKV